MDKVANAIHFIPATERDKYVAVGMAIKHEFGDDGFDIWNDWAKSDDSYKVSSAKADWRSFRSTKVKISTVFYLARLGGWIDSEPFKQVSEEELRSRKEASDRRQKKEEADVARKNKAAAQKSLLLWKSAKPVGRDHPYLVRKKVSSVITLREIDALDAEKILGYKPKCVDTLLTGRLIVVPIKIGDAVVSCEMIDENGIKSAVYGSARAAGFWAAQPLPEDKPGVTIGIGEGVATMLSVKQATGFTVVAALAHHNLEAVAAFFKTRYKHAHMIVMGDLHKKTGEPDPVAVKAAEAVNIDAIFPKFKNDHQGLTDFNDVHVSEGLISLNRVIKNARKV